MAERRPVVSATPDNWWAPPGGSWTYDQVKDLELPFGWELVDGVIMVRGRPADWHDMVKGEIFHGLRNARRPPFAVRVERCVLVDEETVLQPDALVFDPTDLDVFSMECVPVERLRLAVEVVSPGSRRMDRILKPAIMADAGVPYYWRVERGEKNLPVVYEFWLNHESGTYFPAVEHPIHREKLVTEVPYPIEIDLRLAIEQ